MKILMVSPYPPLRDGIAAYAAQVVQALRAEGNEVEVLSPGPSAAHHHLNLVGPRGCLALAKRVRNYDKVIIQFHPDFFYPLPTTTTKRAQVSAALAVAFRMAPNVEVVVHEVNYQSGNRCTPDGLLMRQMWKSVDRIVVHTDSERDKFIKAFGVKGERVAKAPHGGSFIPATTHTKSSARASLGLDPNAYIFLSIGFIQHHKGFDRAVSAFRGLGASGAELHIVGSVRVSDPGFIAYAHQLEREVDSTRGAYLHNGYVSDELFDRWIVAADCVVLPYRHIWSSGLIERARLYLKTTIAADVGGLREQAGQDGDVVFVANDGELRRAMAARCGTVAGLVGLDPWEIPDDSSSLRPRIQEQVVLRAASARGTTLRTDGPVMSADLLVRALGVSAPLRQLAPLGLAPTESRSFLGGLVKRTVRRLVLWELRPIVWQTNAIQSATTSAVEKLAAIEMSSVANGSHEAAMSDQKHDLAE